tara:strand:+ start:63 stop:749 length:687 start_codon:yes stop_codon:yes gene_type:complete
MLALKLGMSLVSSNKGGAEWTPTDESSLEAWWQKGVGITLNGSDVSAWTDSSSNNIDMAQTTAGNQPAYSDGVLTFDPAASSYLQSASGQISLSGDFTIGAKIKPAGLGVVVADLTSSGEFVRFNTTSNLRVKIDGGANTDIPKDSGTYDEEAYMVLTRVSGTLTLHWKGVAQSTTPSVAGTADVDGIGARKPSSNPFDGEMSEIQVYSSSSAALTANINARLLSLMP